MGAKESGGELSARTADEASRPADDRYRDIVHRMPLPMIVVRLDDRRVVDVNDAACAFLGRDRDPLLTGTVDDFTVTRYQRRVKDLLDGGDEVVVVEKRFIRGDGTEVSALAYATQLPGEVSHLSAATLVDQSELVATGARFELLKAVAEIAMRPVGTLDGMDVHLAETARSFDALLGWSATIEVGQLRYPSEVHSPDPDLHQISAAIDDGVRTLGHLSVEGPRDRFLETDEAFVAAVARWVATLTLIGDLQRDLQAAALFEAGFEGTNIGMQVVTPDGTYLRVNRAFAEMLGYEPSQLVGMNWRDVTHPDHARSERRIANRESLGDQGYYEELKRYRTRDDGTVWAKVSISVVDDETSPTGEQVHMVHVIDVTAETIARHELEASERRFRSLLQPSVDLICRVTLDLHIVDANDSATIALGLTPETVIGADARPILPKPVREALAENVLLAAAENRSIELWRQWIEAADRTGAWYVIRIFPEEPGPSGDVEFVYIVATDVTELVESEQRLSALALLDPLTKVANRAAIFDRLQHALDRLERSADTGVAVAMLDLDHFKGFNDAFGHLAGDDVLRAAVEALKSVVRLQDTIGRLGGDEFVVIFEDVRDREQANELAVRIQTMLQDTQAEVNDDVVVDVSASIGVAFTTTRVRGQDLVSRADRAMYEAKRHGRGRIWFERTTDDSDARPTSSSELLRQLGAALPLGQFRLVYQPIIDVESGAVSAVEALLRWQHPTAGLLAPSQFLGALLETGQIGPVGHWVIRSVAEQVRRWADGTHPTPPSVHFNVSPAELADPRLPDILRSATGQFGIDPHMLCIELTEQALAGTVVSTSSLSAVTELGLSVMLDDFGTGVSSLAHLRTPRLDGVKIDRSFVAGAEDGTRDRAIVEGILEIAARMGVDVIVEGVERQDQLVWLRSAGCSRIQGWFFAQAMEPDELMEWMAAREG